MKLILLLSLLIPLSSLASSYKELGERGGTKDSLLAKLGEPTIQREFHAPDFVVKGISPVGCKQANELQTINVWAYKEANGYYQLIFNNNKLICLRWSLNAEPFANIQP